MKQLKTVKNKDFKYLCTLPAHISQRLFNTFGVIPNDIIINLIYKIIVKVKSYQTSSPIALLLLYDYKIYE